MSNSKIGLTQADPGILVYYTLRNLTCYAKENSVDFDDWGICNHRDIFWVGKRVAVDGKNALRVSLLDILESRDERYPDWGDEEINLFVGTDAETGEFKWFLLNKEEWRKCESNADGACM